MDTISVFLLAGQSNMQGFGEIEGHPVLKDDRIFNLATGKAEVAVEPLHHWREHEMPEGIGLGLAMPFALEVLKVYPEMRIGFIPSARGGSALDSWMPGNENFERAIGLYERAKENNPHIEFAGILWHQGETDAGNPETANSYAERFKKVITAFRQRLDAPNAPVIAGETCRVPANENNSYTEGRPTVTAQTQEAIKDLAPAVFVTSEDLIGHDGNTHFDTKSIREFGLRYAKAFLTLVTENRSDKPVWELGKDSIDTESITGNIEVLDGVVTIDGENRFSLPANVLGEQNDYTIELEVKRPKEMTTGHAVVLCSNLDEKNETGIELFYYPPDYNCGWLCKNGHRTVEQREFLTDKFTKITIVVKDKELMMFREGLLLAMTDMVKPSLLPLTFGGAVDSTKKPEKYELRNIKIYDKAIHPTGFDKSAETMRYYSGDQYKMQRVEIKDESLPRILVIGDSISMGYRPFITEHFKGKAYVDYWVGGSWVNGPDSIKGENSPVKRSWDGVLGNGPYDVVTWNPMGLHMWSPQHAPRTPREQYPEMIKEVTDHIIKIAPNTKFIWVRTTPYTIKPDGKPRIIDKEKSERIVHFNKVSDEIMKQYGFPIVDLYGLCERNLDKASPDCVHWEDSASELMAKEICEEIEKQLKKK